MASKAFLSGSVVGFIQIALVVVAGISLLFGATPASARVVITEIYYDPPGVDTGFEWIEIFNEGNEAVDIGEYRFNEAKSNHRIKGVETTTIPPETAAVIVQDSAKFADMNPNYSGLILISSFSLRQSGGIGESLGIVNSAGEIDFQYTYAPDERAGGTGASLHITINGDQIAAPSTPGEVATNPITVQNKKLNPEQQQEDVEQEVLEEVVLEELSASIPEDVGVTQTSHPDLTDGRGGSGYGSPFFAATNSANQGMYMGDRFPSAYPYILPFPYQIPATQTAYNTPASGEPIIIQSTALIWIAAMVTIIVANLSLFFVFALVVYLKWEQRGGGKVRPAVVRKRAKKRSVGNIRLRR